MDANEVNRVFDKVCARAGELQSIHLAEAQKYGSIKLTFEQFKPLFWQVAKNNSGDPEIRQFYNTGMANAVAVLSGLDSNLGSGELIGLSNGSSFLALSAETFGASSTSETIHLSLPYHILPGQILPPNEAARTELYAKLGAVDTTLGRTYGQVWEDLLGTTQEPERAAATLMRQTWDILFRILSPNEEVQKSARWVSRSMDESETNKNLKIVTRLDRVHFALAKVPDPMRRRLIEAPAQQMIKHYGVLNSLHSSNALNAEEVRAAIFAFHSWFAEWMAALPPKSEWR